MGRWYRVAAGLVAAVVPTPPARSQQLSLEALVTPSTVIRKDGKPVTFAIHGFVEFQSLTELFPYIAKQEQRWKGKVNDGTRQRLQPDLLRRGVQSRVVSMVDERPLETLLTHTGKELREAIGRVEEPVPAGYAEAFVAVQEKWKHALNCWSASPSIVGRVLSNWYPIEEGIRLYGATYDSTEHFWQAVKYHPDLTVGDVLAVLAVLEQRDWRNWLARLDDDPVIYLSNAYAVEFLRHNLATVRLRWFREEIARERVSENDHARAVQERGAKAFRFSAFEEKVLWGDLADVLHLVYVFSAQDDPIRKTLAERHFDGIYLNQRKMEFIGEEFRSLMLEIWRVKYLQMARFGEVMRTIPIEIRLEHFLNDGDSPDIPIPVYVGYLNQIRDLAREAR